MKEQRWEHSQLMRWLLKETMFSLFAQEKGDTHNPYFCDRKRSVENSKETGGRKDIYDPAESKNAEAEKEKYLKYTR